MSCSCAGEISKRKLPLTPHCSPGIPADRLPSQPGDLAAGPDVLARRCQGRIVERGGIDTDFHRIDCSRYSSEAPQVAAKAPFSVWRNGRSLAPPARTEIGDGDERIALRRRAGNPLTGAAMAVAGVESFASSLVANGAALAAARHQNHGLLPA